MLGRRSQHNTQKRTQRQGIRIFQANTGRSSESHDTALALAAKHAFEVVLIQEPHTAIFDNGSVCRIRSHQSYLPFTPVTHWSNTSERPRVATYVLASSRLTTEQITTFKSRDLLVVRVCGITTVNVYREPHQDHALDLLVGWTPPARCFVAGDFNALHPLWQEGSGRDKGWKIAEWATSHDLELLNPPNTPTRGPNTLDLAFSNIPGADTTVEDHLTTASDHSTLASTLPADRITNSPSRRIIVHKDQQQTFCIFIAERANQLERPTNPTNEDLDFVAEQLTGLINAAIRVAGKAPPGPTLKQETWWTEDCDRARTAWHYARRHATDGADDELAEYLHKDFRRTIRKARRDRTRGFFDQITKPEDIYKVTRWLRPSTSFQPPPLQVGDEVFESQHDRAYALRQATLERKTAADDIASPWEALVTPERTLELTTEITFEQAKWAATCTGNTSPGVDNVTVDLLKACWPAIGDTVRWLYESCLQQGHHPRSFKEAEVVMIPKPKKRDLATPRAWRPISLLSCLAKGLERLLARRIATAVEARVLHQNQFGALPRRSAVDLASCVTHDLEIALAEGKVATIVTADIQGAFDAALSGRLVVALRQQGWPRQVIKFVQSFMTDRQARVRLQDTTTEMAPLSCGLPQGSPLSPVLFLLYTEGIYRILGSGTKAAAQAEGLDTKGLKGLSFTPPASRFGYADDTLMLRTGRNLFESAALAQQDLDDLIEWGNQNGVTFDPAKTEVMHFSRQQDHGLNPPILHDMQEKAAGKKLRWLGIWFDRYLSFQPHIQEWAISANRVTGLLRNFTKTRAGPYPAAARRGILACCLPTLTYGSEVWYRGTKKPATADKGTRTSFSATTQITVNHAKATIHKAIRTILPVWRTTPIPILHLEAAIPPIKQILEGIRRRSAARLASLDSYHPLVSRAMSRPPRRHCALRLQTLPGFVPAGCPRPRLLLGQPPRKNQQLPKEEAAATFRQWHSSLPKEDLVVFSDGSRSQNGEIGYGFVLCEAADLYSKRPIASLAARLGDAEVFDAEAAGALAGLEAALSIPGTHTVHVCLDNTAALAGLLGAPSDSSQHIFLRFQHLSQGRDVYPRWCPGHMGIPGNEAADAQAKRGCLLPRPPRAQPSLAFVRREARQWAETNFAHWWSLHRHPSYERWEIKPTLKAPQTLYNTRSDLHRLLAIRSGHGDFADYHEKWQHDLAELHCSCGRRKVPTHPLYCRKVQVSQRLRLSPGAAAQVPLLVGKQHKRLLRFLKETDFYTKICPR